MVYIEYVDKDVERVGIHSPHFYQKYHKNDINKMLLFSL